MAGSAFAAELARRRAAAQMSLAQLASTAHVNRSYLYRVETGERWPAETVARLLDETLCAHGVLLDAWRAGEDARRAAAEDARCVATSIRESRALDVLLADVPLGEAVTAAEEIAAALAVDYLRRPPMPMLAVALDARTAAVHELNRAPSTGQRRDLIRVAGYLSGVLAYAALDLNHADAAAGHAATAWRCAQSAGDPELAAWARGTQSLIARFENDYPTALALARAGLDHAPVTGTSRPRLLAGVAQSAANMGDRGAAHRGLDAAGDATDRATADAFGGLFRFSRAKLAYYAGSALMWLPEPADARRAADSAVTAVSLWENGDPTDRSLDDEALAHVYAAGSYIRLGELDAADALLRPVLTLPPERRISWLQRRVGDIGALLTAPRFAGSATAAKLLADVRAFG